MLKGLREISCQKQLESTIIPKHEGKGGDLLKEPGEKLAQEKAFPRSWSLQQSLTAHSLAERDE